MSDVHHLKLNYRLSEIEHRYGLKVHVLGQPVLMTLLARLCSPKTHQPEINRLTAMIYKALAMAVANAEFPRCHARIPTRMAQANRRGVYEGEVLDPATKIVLVDIARAGILPAQTCFDVFCELVRPHNVRQDHIFAQRMTHQGRVTHADLRGSKIGGRFDGAHVVIPDPMAATGSSLSAVLDYVKGLRRGRPKKIIAAHLIVTPEYLRRIQQDHPEVVVYAARLDRGLSSKRVLSEIPGEYWDLERGLNEHQYIIPGGGGMGELLSNAPE